MFRSYLPKQFASCHRFTRQPLVKRYYAQTQYMVGQTPRCIKHCNEPRFNCGLNGKGNWPFGRLPGLMESVIKKHCLQQTAPFSLPRDWWKSQLSSSSRTHQWLTITQTTQMKHNAVKNLGVFIMWIVHRHFQAYCLHPFRQYHRFLKYKHAVLSQTMCFRCSMYMGCIQGSAALKCFCASVGKDLPPAAYKCFLSYKLSRMENKHKTHTSRNNTSNMRNTCGTWEPWIR